jgi:hypothetical protein
MLSLSNHNILQRSFCTSTTTTVTRKPPRYWKDIRNQRKFFDKLAIELNIKRPNDWRQVRVRTVLEKGGSFVKQYYNESLIRALSIAYPEFGWKAIPRKPHNYKPPNYWVDIKNQRLFFDKLAETLHIQKPEDWYSVDVKTILSKGGWFLLNYYNRSLIKGLYYKSWMLVIILEIYWRWHLYDGCWLLIALNAVYPEHKWEYIEPKAYWSDKDNQRFFFDQLAKTLNIKKPEDWYHVRVKTVIKHGGYFVSNYYTGSLIRGILIVFYSNNL